MSDESIKALELRSALHRLEYVNLDLRRGLIAPALVGLFLVGECLVRAAMCDTNRFILSVKRTRRLYAKYQERAINEVLRMQRQIRSSK